MAITIILMSITINPMVMNDCTDMCQGKSSSGEKRHMISEVQIILRVLVGAALGAVIGLERERDNQPAGLRTI